MYMINNQRITPPTQPYRKVSVSKQKSRYIPKRQQYRHFEILIDLYSGLWPCHHDSWRE